LIQPGPCRFNATGLVSRKFLRRFFQKSGRFLSRVKLVPTPGIEPGTY
jgi:hypothetical protein